MRKFFSFAQGLAVGAVLAPGLAGASGFALLEQSGSGLGRAFSGTASVADDASVLYYNPAAMTKLANAEAVLAVTGIDVASHFHDGASAPALGQPLGDEGGNGGTSNAIPAFYLTAHVLPAVSIGVGVNAPFGLRTDYDDFWIGRFQALKSDVKTLNVNPSIAWQVTDSFSIGAGANFQKLRAELGSAVNYTAAIAQVNPLLVPSNAGLQGFSSVRGDDHAWGYNVGALLDLNPRTRLGLAYRSSLKYDVTGSVSFAPATASNPTGAAIIAGASAPGGPLANGPVALSLKLPDSATASLSQIVSDQLSLMADVSWTGWNKFDQLRIVRSSGAVLAATPENWKNTWRFAVGGEYKVAPALKLRAGVAFDEAPVPNATRTPRLPDQDRKWLAVGVSWKPFDTLTFDLGFAHLLLKNASLDDDGGNALAYGVLNGRQKSHIDILALQAAAKF